LIVPQQGEDAGPRANKPTILSAYGYHDPDEPPGDRIVVVFSDDVDAASLVPSAFLVTLGDGRRRTPSTARLSPANEMDENRTVTLTGEFGITAESAPTDILVYDSLYSESGDSLTGLTAKVEIPQTLNRIVATEFIADNGECPGMTIVRTYWLAPLFEVDDADRSQILAAIRATTVRPLRLADRDVDTDNVLDLCFEPKSKPKTLRIAPQTFRGPNGLGNQDQTVEVDAPANSRSTTSQTPAEQSTSK
jgi:hypothetical protein